MILISEKTNIPFILDWSYTEKASFFECEKILLKISLPGQMEHDGLTKYSDSS